MRLRQERLAAVLMRAGIRGLLEALVARNREQVRALPEMGEGFDKSDWGAWAAGISGGQNPRIYRALSYILLVVLTRL